MSPLAAGHVAFSAGSVAPLSLLVPIFGLTTSAWLLGEKLQPWKLTAFALVMAGLTLGVLWPRFKGMIAA